MGKIARQLIKSQYITDFTRHDTDSVNLTEGAIRFIWQVRKNGTWLYLYNEQEWESKLIERIDYYRQAGISNIYYLYDRNKLHPIFENEVRYLAQKRIEVRETKLSTNTTDHEEEIKR
jgi:hypothetical protein